MEILQAFCDSKNKKPKKMLAYWWDFSLVPWLHIKYLYEYVS
uniref:Uncharacterized protein n=1 Tax=viral metagenome TaxID=1070528 RepID=A0A6C0ADW1_9ZZZZ